MKKLLLILFLMTGLLGKFPPKVLKQFNGKSTSLSS
jgi:hypothetical protein